MQQVWTTMPRPAAVFSQEAKQEAMLMARGIPMGLPTGFTTLDRTVRLREGQLIVVAARSSFGKTSFALQVAMHNALNLEASWDDGCVVFFSAEMSGAELFQKMASTRSGVNLQRGYAGQWSQADAKAFNDALDDLSTLPLVVNDLNVIKTETMRENLKMLASAGRPARLVVFDYVELGADDGKFKENERVAMVVHRLKSIARDLSIPVLALSQINRDIEKESRHRLPLIQNLAGSDAVGRTADKVLTLLIPNLYLRTGVACACEYIEDSIDTAYVSVQKDRFGRRGDIFRLRWQPTTASFDDLPASDPRPRYVQSLKVRSPEDATRYWNTLRPAPQPAGQADPGVPQAAERIPAEATSQ
jgi:replicative DNA helicase